MSSVKTEARIIDCALPAPYDARELGPSNKRLRKTIRETSTDEVRVRH